MRDGSSSIRLQDGQYTELDDIYLPPLNYGGIYGYVYAADTGYGLSSGVTVTVDIPGGDDLVGETGPSGKYPKCYPESGAGEYYAFDVEPGTYTVNFEHDDYYTYSEQVTVVAGENSEMDVTLVREWYSPEDHNDPDSDWNYEDDAYDDYIYSCAISDKKLIQGWTGYLELTIAQMDADKIRFYAFYDSEYCSSIDLDIYYSGSWHDVYQGAFANKEYVEKSLGGIYPVTKARVSFYIKGASSPEIWMDVNFFRRLLYWI